eukprot:CAMPEP_0196823004 /NCGR_PEP_ID=MMETSP1362-20130617/85680_1 /TAXON_ID=163516 /ORGANISM="Leptocylindrus danicus, Strain CCMP1856" /LENGTH=1194 /DNA_ID=CAMNT_0042202721 /DNA_START=298 /DNA_END=3883 /DNA_ORIENTATION=+
MDPERIHAYLQAACAGLGFDIGEVWRITGPGAATSKSVDSGIIPCLPLNTQLELFPPSTSSSSSNSSTSSASSTSTAVADPSGVANQKKLLRFVQLHTSLSYNDKRSKLVCPTTGVTLESNYDYPDPEEDAENVSKHVLSPSLINAVSSTKAEIIWANNHDQDGLLGRSDMRLQTAVGMPVAVDNDGNMCVVVMFSPNDIKSSDESLEYLHFISRSATSFNIPCLLPVIKDPSKILQFVDYNQDDNGNDNDNDDAEGVMMDAGNNDYFNHDNVYDMGERIIQPRGGTLARQLNMEQLAMMQETDLGRRGVTARLFSFGNSNNGSASAATSSAVGKRGRKQLNDGKVVIGSEPEVHIVHDISTEPCDSFGIPMLPTEGYDFHYDMDLSGDDNSIFDGTFDEASYGVWSTIMQSEQANAGINAISNHGDDQALEDGTVGQRRVVTLLNGNASTAEGEEQKSMLPQRISSDSSLNLLAQVTASAYEPFPNDELENIDVTNSVDTSFSSDFIRQNSTNSLGGINENRASRSAHASHVRKITKAKKDRLEEFAQAFLGMSVFDIADIWMPFDETTDKNDVMLLNHVSSMTNDPKNEDFIAFRQFSVGSTVKMWSGAVGRAFASGNPVWSRNEKMIVDSNRAHAFHQAQIKSVLSVPVLPAGCKTPVCVVTCYSQSRVNCNPHVLRFVQQAVRLLWDGFDSVTPHASVGSAAWKEVAPEDVGKMAADVGLHQVFLKKRPLCEVSSFSEDHKAKRSGSKEGDSSHQQYQTTATIAPTPSLATTNPPLLAETKVQEEPDKPVTTGVEDMSNDFVRLKLPIGSESLLNTNNSKVRPKVAPLIPAIPIPGLAIAPADTSIEKTPDEVVKKAEPVPVPAPVPAPAPISVAPAPSNVNVNVNPALLPPGMAMPPPHMGALPWMHCMPTNLSMPPPPISTAIKNGGKMDRSNNTNTFPLQFQQLAFTDYSQQQQGTIMDTANNNPSVQHAAAVAAAAAAGMNMNTMLYMPTLSTALTMQQQMDALNAAAASGNKQTLGANSFPATLALNRPLDKKLCRIEGCEDPVNGRKPYCLKHSGVRNCEFAGCKKCAQGATRFCIAHGGGRRCTYPGCNKGARDKYFCAGHGGGRDVQLRAAVNRPLVGRIFVRATVVVDAVLWKDVQNLRRLRLSSASSMAVGRGAVRRVAPRLLVGAQSSVLDMGEVPVVR